MGSLLIYDLHQLNYLNRRIKYNAVERLADAKHEVSHDFTLLIYRLLALDDRTVYLSHLSVKVALNGADIDLRSVGVYSDLRNGQKVSIGEKFFFEIFMASEGLMQDLVGLIENIVIEVTEMLEDKLIALWGSLRNEQCGYIML